MVSTEVPSVKSRQNEFLKKVLEPRRTEIAITSKQPHFSWFWAIKANDLLKSTWFLQYLPEFHTSPKPDRERNAREARMNASE